MENKEARLLLTKSFELFDKGIIDQLWGILVPDQRRGRDIFEQFANLRLPWVHLHPANNIVRIEPHVMFFFNNRVGIFLGMQLTGVMIVGRHPREEVNQLIGRIRNKSGFRPIITVM